MGEEVIVGDGVCLEKTLQETLIRMILIRNFLDDKHIALIIYVSDRDFPFVVMENGDVLSSDKD